MEYKVGDRLRQIKACHCPDNIGKEIVIESIEGEIVISRPPRDANDIRDCGKWTMDYLQENFELVTPKITLPHLIVHTPTQEDYNRLMRWLEDNTDLRWVCEGEKPTELANAMKSLAFPNEYIDIAGVIARTLIPSSFITTQEFFEKYGGEVKITSTPSKYFEEFGSFLGAKWCKSYFTNQESNQSLTKKTMRKLSELSQKVRRAFSPEQKALYQAGYINEHGEWTSRAQDIADDEILSKWLDDNKADMVERAKEELSLSKEEKDSCDC